MSDALMEMLVKGQLELQETVKKLNDKLDAIETKPKEVPREIPVMTEIQNGLHNIQIYFCEKPPPVLEGQFGGLYVKDHKEFFSKKECEDYGVEKYGYNKFRVTAIQKTYSKDVFIKDILPLLKAEVKSEVTEPVKKIVKKPVRRTKKK